jgi:hypothetical protein
MRLSHSERKSRRKLIAQRCEELSPQFKRLCDLHAKISEEFKVSPQTVSTACKEFGMMPRLNITPSEPEIHPKSLKIVELLRNPKLSYRDIASMVGCSKQNVSLIHKKYFMEGFDLPSRAEVYDRRKTERDVVLHAKAKECLDYYFEHDDLKEAARVAGISLSLAKTTLREHNANAKAALFNKGGPVLGRWAYVMADLLKGEQTGSELARKWSLPAPRIFNIIAELRTAGITIKLPDGRQLLK